MPFFTVPAIQAFQGYKHIYIYKGQKWLLNMQCIMNISFATLSTVYLL
jgi:hypothetical protein